MESPSLSIGLRALLLIVSLSFGLLGFGLGLSVSFFFISRSLDAAREYQVLAEKYLFDLGKCTVYMDHFRKSLAAANSRDVRVKGGRKDKQRGKRAGKGKKSRRR